MSECNQADDSAGREEALRKGKRTAIRVVTPRDAFDGVDTRIRTFYDILVKIDEEEKAKRSSEALKVEAPAI